ALRRDSAVDGRETGRRYHRRLQLSGTHATYELQLAAHRARVDRDLHLAVRRRFPLLAHVLKDVMVRGALGHERAESDANRRLGTRVQRNCDQKNPGKCQYTSHGSHSSRRSFNSQGECLFEPRRAQRNPELSAPSARSAVAIVRKWNANSSLNRGRNPGRDPTPSTSASAPAPASPGSPAATPASR